MNESNIRILKPDSAEASLLFSYLYFFVLWPILFIILWIVFKLFKQKIETLKLMFISFALFIVLLIAFKLISG